MKTILRCSTRALLLVLVPIFAAAAGEDFVRTEVPGFPAPQADRALLYIVRPAFVHLLANPTFEVFVDDRPAGYLPQRSYLTAQLEPGRHRISGPTANEPRSFNVESGNTYVLVLVESYGTNRIVTGTSWESGDPADIRRLVEEGRLSQVATTESGMLKLERKAGTANGGESPAAAPDAKPAVLPATFTTVWYRTGERAASLKSYDFSGALTVNADTIHFESKKKTFDIPTASIQSVALDRMTNNPFDPNEWGIVIYGAGPSGVAGFKDGHGLGHGTDTERIYQALSAAADAARRPAQTAARDTDVVPAGFIRYRAYQNQFTMIIPQDWMAYDQSAALKDVPGRFGLIFFLASADFHPDPQGNGRTPSQDVAVGLSRGDIPSFFVQRQPAGDGMSCSGFSERATKAVLELTADAATFGKASGIAQGPQAEPTKVAGCRGLKIDNSGRAAGSSQWTVRTYAASDGETLYLFVLRNLAENYARNSPVFERIVATAELPLAH